MLDLFSCHVQTRDGVKSNSPTIPCASREEQLALSEAVGQGKQALGGIPEGVEG